MRFARILTFVFSVGVLVGSLWGQRVDRLQAEPEQTEVAEHEDEIETDRDSFTPATTTADRCRTIFEAAHSFIDNRSVPAEKQFAEHDLPTLVWVGTPKQ